MIKFENVVLPSPDQWHSIIMGMRNPLNSWHKSDSQRCSEYDGCGDCPIFNFEGMDGYGVCCKKTGDSESNTYVIGTKDFNLMKKLCASGTADHRKFMRMITVYVDIIAPLYFFKEMDQYKIGTVSNSCSTMHKIHEKEFTIDDFSHEHLVDDYTIPIDKAEKRISLDVLKYTIEVLNYWRNKYIATKNKEDWYQMIQLLPSSYNQKRTYLLNYEVLANIYKSRKNHRLDEWSVGFVDFIKSLPYSMLITGEYDK